MIGSLRGEVLDRGLDGTVLVEVGGVGYLVTVSPQTLSELEPTTTVFLHVHHHIREDGQTLYGFADARRAGDVPDADRHARRGSGARHGHHRHPFARSPRRHRRRRRRRRPHVGAGRRPQDGRAAPHRAENRLSVPVLDPVGAPGGGSVVGDVREALAGLGYGPDEIREVLRELPGDADAATSAARRPQAAGGATCVTSSSKPASSATPRTPSRPGCALAASPSSSASAS